MMKRVCETLVLLCMALLACEDEPDGPTVESETEGEPGDYACCRCPDENGNMACWTGEDWPTWCGNENYPDTYACELDYHDGLPWNCEAQCP